MMAKRGNRLALNLKLPRNGVELPVVDPPLPGCRITEILPGLFIGGSLKRQSGRRQR